MQPQDGTLTGQQATLNALQSISINYGGAAQAEATMSADSTVGPQGQAAVVALVNSPFAKQYQDLVDAAIAAVESGN